MSGRGLTSTGGCGSTARGAAPSGDAGRCNSSTLRLCLSSSSAANRLNSALVHASWASRAGSGLASSPSALRQLCLATFRRTNLVLTLGLSPENVQTFSKRWRMIRKPSPVGRMTAKLFTYLNEREPKRDQPRTLTVSLAQLCQSLSGPDGHLHVSGITAFHSCGAAVLPQTVLLLVIADLPEAARAGASNPPLTAAPASHSPVSAGALELPLAAIAQPGLVSRQ